MRKWLGLALVAACLAVPGLVAADPSEETTAPLQTCESGSLEVQLLGLQSGLSSRDLRTTAAGKEVRWTRLDLRLLASGAPSRLWLPQGMELRNARGGVWRPAQMSVFFRPNGEGSFSFPDPPASFKGPWKLKLELARNARYLPYEFWDVFSPEELWNVPLLPLPEPPDARPLRTHAAEAVRNGVHLRLVQVAGSQAAVSFGKVRQPAKPSLQVRYSPAVPALNVTLIRATDFKGRLIPLAGAPLSSTASTLAERSILFPMVTKQDSRVLNATFAVHRSRFVELSLSLPRRPLPVRKPPVVTAFAAPAVR
jgi:hypothetical protein